MEKQGLQMMPVVGIVLGDHAGSAPEMAIKAVLASKGNYTPVFIGNRERFEISCSVVDGANRLEIREFQEKPKFAGNGVAYFFDVPGGPDIQFSKVTGDSGVLIFESIKKAIELERRGIVDGLSMAPITKAALHAAGYKYSSEFEIFADLYGSTGVKAVIKCENIFRSTVIGHCAFREIADRLTADGIIETAQGLLTVMKKFMPANKCKIAVAALNPHAGEGGLFGYEERDVIRPAIESLLAKGEYVIGPSPADTVFLKARSGEVHGVVFLYHDQGNIAMKSCYFGDGVLIYINIPGHIVSVGHGPAFGKAGKGTADPKNMIASIDVLLEIIKNR